MANKNLVIVESPAKAKTISKFLDSSYRVLSSVGHIRDIPTKKGKDGKPPIDTANNFATIYEIDSEKRKLIAELRKAAKEAETIYIATDEDREGEAIGWHLCEVLKIDPLTTKRIVFHEITKTAILHALETPRTIDMDLVYAQQARRVLDRLVGFELSPVVQRKVPGGKSAGRVQSPAVRLLVEREREIQAYEGSTEFKVTGEFAGTDADQISAGLPTKFASEPEAKTFLESLIGADFSVSSVTTNPSTRNPGAPYTTSTLQQDAASRLGFSVKSTMTSAQRLYQAGKITYMRTDSVNLSPEALGAMTAYITREFGAEYHQYRTFKTKSASAQEAHEAIRPTDVSQEIGSSDAYEQKLYNLIRTRTLASQMAPAKLERTTAKIAISSSKELFEAKGEVIIFPGFLKVFGASKKDAVILPPLKSGDKLDMLSAQAKQIFSRPPARYSEGSLVKKLEELGIGRPSTYASIISTIQDRGYAEKGDGEGEPREIIVLSLDKKSVERSIEHEKTGSDRGKLVPTPAGGVVVDFLSKHFDQVVDYDFTAKVEEQFDIVANGKMVWHKMLRDFYDPFHKLIESSGDISRADAAQSREIGLDPKTGKMIISRFGRFGPMLQLGLTEDETFKPVFANLPRGTRIETVTLEQALEAFKLPRFVGLTTDGKEIKANIGRFGPYIVVDKMFVSIKPIDPHDITLDQALEFLAEKIKKEAERHIATFGDIQVLNGQYGPYITDGTKNAKIPKDTDPKDLTEEQCRDLIAKAPARKAGRGRFGKKKAAPKTTKRVVKRKPAAKKKTVTKKPATPKSSPKSDFLAK
jgi:DNA topoisomerase I